MVWEGWHREMPPDPDVCLHDGTLIAETDDDAPPDRCRPPRADQDAPFRRRFTPPLTHGRNDSGRE